MNLMQIEYFLEVCKTLNFTNAAKNLYVSQSALSRQIQLLEEELRVSLLIRNNRSVVLTQAGTVFRDDFSKIMSDIQNALQHVRKSANVDKEIRIGIFQPLSYNLIGDIMERIDDFFMGIKIAMYKHNPVQLKENFESGKLDLILLLNEMKHDYDNSEYRIIKPLRAGVLMAVPMYEKYAENFSICDLNNEKMICLEEDYAPGLMDFQKNIMKKCALNPKEILYTGDIISALKYSEPEHGFVITYENQEVNWMNGVKFIPLNQDEFQYHIAVCWRKNINIPFEKCFS